MTVMKEYTRHMRAAGIGFEQFEEDFYAQNTFICGSTATLRSEAAAQLSHLNAGGNTVLVTDPYLFPSAADSTYQADLIALLKGLNATKITYCAKSKRNETFFQQAQTILQSVGTVLEFTCKMEDCHDRFWYCPETEKCVVFGTSLNGIGRKICRIDMLTSDETVELKQYFIRAGIIASGVNNGT